MIAIAFFLVQLFKVAHSQQPICHTPSGIDDGSGISTQNVMDLLDGTTLGDPLPYLFLPLAEPLIGNLVSNYETPIQFRQAFYQGVSVYNVAAMYHPTALDTWGREDNRICIDKFTSDLQMKAHEQLATAYTFAYSAITMVAPSSKDIFTNIMENVLMLPMSKLSGEPDLGTPWGLAKATVDQIAEYSKSDGWNSEGNLTHAFNKMPFSDFDYNEYSAYKVASPKASMSNNNKSCNKEWYWEPLLETNHNGYFTRQEHVTPFAGFTGRLYGMTSSEYEKFTVSAPEYDYCEEASFVLSETEEMSGDDKKKVEIEFYDSKFTSLLPMQINWSIQNQLSSFDFWYNDMVLVTAMYDAIMLVWREKVAFNAVRPTTVVAALKGEEEVESYAGPYAGSQTIKGNDWQPYIRTMPHAEYPSGSSCVCTAFVEVMQLLTGQDSTGQFPVGLPFEAGSSKLEPGITPSTTINLIYSKWSEVQEVCGVSRLYGGMHFSKAVPAGEQLCTGISSLVVNRTELLKAGDANGALADLDDTSITIKKRPGTAYKCVDSALRLKIKIGDTSISRSCDWVGRKHTTTRCALSGVAAACPKTCATCEDCVDPDDSLRFDFEYNGKTIRRNCDFVGSVPSKTYGYCTASGNICKQTCGMCHALNIFV